MFIYIVAPAFCIIAHQVAIRCLLEKNRPTVPPTTENTIFIFDIHGVLFLHDYRCMLNIFLQSKQKWALLATIFNPKFLFHVITYTPKRSLAEAFFIYFATYHPPQPVWDLFIAIANCLRINWPVIKLVHKLKDHGYRLGILSNISEDVFLELQTLYPSIFELFDPIITTSAYNNFATKPSPEVYKHLLQEIDPEHTVMFIDDNQKNVCGSLPFGITALKFNSIHELKKQLQTLGIVYHS